ncbi:hypothetical protein K438DRAFT_1759823 [Mycena galopus ATCC 62051]|nr:hypothetical protein K438DRAFT_1759823 [Mycena galopus ATCC 62051]
MLTVPLSPPSLIFSSSASAFSAHERSRAVSEPCIVSSGLWLAVRAIETHRARGQPQIVRAGLPPGRFRVLSPELVIISERRPGVGGAGARERVSLRVRVPVKLPPEARPRAAVARTQWGAGAGAGAGLCEARTVKLSVLGVHGARRVRLGPLERMSRGRTYAGGGEARGGVRVGRSGADEREGHARVGVRMRASEVPGAVHRLHAASCVGAMSPVCAVERGRGCHAQGSVGRSERETDGSATNDVRCREHELCVCGVATCAHSRLHTYSLRARVVAVPYVPTWRLITITPHDHDQPASPCIGACSLSSSSLFVHASGRERGEGGHGIGCDEAECAYSLRIRRTVMRPGCSESCACGRDGSPEHARFGDADTDARREGVVVVDTGPPACRLLSLTLEGSASRLGWRGCERERDGDLSIADIPRTPDTIRLPHESKHEDQNQDGDEGFSSR